MNLFLINSLTHGLILFNFYCACAYYCVDINITSVLQYGHNITNNNWTQNWSLSNDKLWWRKKSRDFKKFTRLAHGLEVVDGELCHGVQSKASCFPVSSPNAMLS